MYYLPETEELGKLEIKKVYSFYDVPRTFLAENKKTKSSYLVYWFSESETEDQWYYAPVNAMEIRNLDSGFIQIRDFFTNKNLLVISTPYDNSTYKLITTNYHKIQLDTLPPTGYFVSVDDDGEFSINRQFDKDLSSNVHEVRIYRDRSEKNIDWNPIQKIINSWNSLYGKLIKSQCDEDDSLIPYAASIGSYKSKFIAEKNDLFLSNIQGFIDAIKSEGSEFNSIKEFGIDLDDFEDLLSNLRTYNYKLEIISNTGASIFTIDAKKLASEQEKIQEHNQRYFASDLVPQADDIYRVIKLIECTAKNELFNEESEGITSRQISYYKHAAKLLGLIKDNGFVLQPLGWKVYYASSNSDKLSLLAGAFENSVCGWAWMKYCDVEDILDVELESAKDFLIEKANGLSENTAKRRAKTLNSWLTEFKKK